MQKLSQKLLIIGLFAFGSSHDINAQLAIENVDRPIDVTTDAIASADPVNDTPAPISWSQLGAKATAENKGDAIGITATRDGAHLRTGFQKLNGSVTENGLTLNSTNECGGSLTLKAQAVGRATGHSELTEHGMVSMTETTVRYVRPGLTEEFSVSADGVRQDFVLMERPRGSGELHVKLALHGAFAEPAADGVQLTLDASGRELSYGKLLVTDANGQELVASMDVADEHLLVVHVEDANATYPVRIDPTFSDANWVSMGTAMTEGVFAMVQIGTDIYVGGRFTTAGVANTAYIAKWNGSTWSALGTGMNGNVFALAVIGTDLYAGGDFTTAGGVPANRIAKWDGTNWTALIMSGNNGVNNSVRALAVIGSTLYVGGVFTQAGGIVVNIAYLAKWNAGVWSSVTGGPMSSIVRALAVIGTDLYIGGDFSYGVSSTINFIAKWNGTTVSGLNYGLSHRVSALTVIGTNLYVGGDFTHDAFGFTVLNRVAKWDGGTWSGSALGSGMNAPVYSLTTDGTNLYAGGAFTTAGGGSANRIAKWNGSSWSALGSGMNNTVFSLKVFDENLYAGGLFTVAGSTAGPYIAKGLLGPDSDGDGTVDELDDCPLALPGISNFNTGTCNCDPAYFQVTTLVGANTVITGCTICPAGYFCPDGTVAQPCAAGSFSSATGQIACALCAANTYNPFVAQTECLSCPNGESSGVGAIECTPDVICTINLSLDITLPVFGTLPTYELRRVSDDGVAQSGGGGFGNPGTNQLYTCLPNGNYYLVVTGMPASGSYVLRGADAPFTRLIDNITASTGNGQVTEFTVAPAALSSNGTSQIPIGPNELLNTSCDKYFWKNGEYLVVNEDAEVAAEWVPFGANAVQDATTGYDFWFYDPNGGYSYIRQRRHNVSDNFASVGSARTCHMKVNNWAGANYIPNGVPLNVRVRAVVQNTPKNWGPACRFTRDEALGNCPPTKLFDVVGYPQFQSCGVFRDFTVASSNRLYARPVGGANMYRFTLSNGEGTIVREVPTYYLTLGWSAPVAPPLTPGSTYDVTVQARVGGVWCIVGETCLVTINNQATGGAQNSVVDASTNAALKLWPNPNNGDQLNVSLLLDVDVNTISMDILDLSGKRMVTRTIPTQDGIVNTAVDIQGELASGMYMVQITAGDKVFSQRVVIQQ